MMALFQMAWAICCLNSVETWPSGRRHFPAKEACGLKPASRVRIPESPPKNGFKQYQEISKPAYNPVFMRVFLFLLVSVEP